VLEFENAIPIDRPIDEVFAFLSDFENIPKWNYYVLEVRQLSESPIGTGTTYHQVRKTDEQVFRIIEFEPNNTVAVKTLPRSSPSFERRFTLYEEGDTTRIRDFYKRGKGDSSRRPTSYSVANSSRSCRPYAHSSWTVWLCRILDADFRESPFHALRSIALAAGPRGTAKTR
jgi:hypothetical protein